MAEEDEVEEFLIADGAVNQNQFQLLAVADQDENEYLDDADSDFTDLESGSEDEAEDDEPDSKQALIKSQASNQLGAAGKFVTPSRKTKRTKTARGKAPLALTYPTQFQ